MRISTTTLESFRLYKTGDWMKEQELQDTIRGKFTGGPKVWRGSAFGAVLEDPVRYRVHGGYRITPWNCPRSYFFSDAVMEQALPLMDYRYGVFEPKIVGQYEGCDIVAKADQIVGLRLKEHKTTEKFDFDKYYDSLQWRIECDLFEAQSCTYHVFVLDEKTSKDDEQMDPSDSIILLRSIETMTVYPYAAMRNDICRWVRDFKAYVQSNGLDQVLEEHQRRAGAV